MHVIKHAQNALAAHLVQAFGKAYDHFLGAINPTAAEKL